MSRHISTTLLIHVAHLLHMHTFQVQAAIRRGLLDAAVLDDRDSADQIAGRADTAALHDAVGCADDRAKHGTALVLQRLRPDVMFSADTVVALALDGHIAISGYFDSEPVYSAASVAAFSETPTCQRVIIAIAARHEKVTRNEAAAIIGHGTGILQRHIDAGDLAPAQVQETQRLARPLGELFMLADVLALPGRRKRRPEIRGFGPTTLLDDRLAPPIEPKDAS